MAAYAALSSLAQTTNLTRNQANYPLFIVAEEKIGSIHEYVIFLLSFLEEFPERAKRWEAKMRDLAHETEDIIQQFTSQQLRRRIKPSSVIFEEQLRNAAENFCLIAGDMMDDRPAYSHLDFSSSFSSLSRNIEPTGNGEVIGLEEDLMEVKERLCGLSPKLQFITIVGMGGIGKTTLARTLYDDSLIMEYFHIRVWLTISQDCSRYKILLGLVDSMKLIKEEMSRDDIDDCMMSENVYKKLKGRRYLIVMDDVWSTEVLDDVRYIFPDDSNGSRILLTTRLSNLASYTDSNSPHEMKFMNDSQSWDLLEGKVFGNGNCPSELEDVGKQIARRCVGLPLGVVLVAGFLSAVDKTRFSWEKIAENVNQIVGQEMEGILSLSYTHLPHHLRPCFLYMGGFPEDESIRASRLIKLWVAESFLRHENGCLEEEAEEYLEELVKRNLVIVTTRKSNGRMKRCSLHDMVRDLCIRKGHDEKLLRVMDDDRRVAPRGSTNYVNIQYGSRLYSVLDSEQRKAQDEKFLCIMDDCPIVSQAMSVGIQLGIHYGNADDWGIRRARVMDNIRFLQSMTRDDNIDVEVDWATREADDEKFLRMAPQGMMNERRISFRLPSIDHFWCPTIRTILCFQLQNFPSYQAFFGRFRLLKVLDAIPENSSKVLLPSQLFQLFHLRYLALICSSHIPSGIANFMNLQTLIILPSTSKWKRYWRAGENVSHFSLPLEIWRMPRLRHLVLYDLCRLPHPPNGSSNPLEDLQTLTYVKDLIWTEKILEMIPNLRKLGLAYDTNNELQLYHLKHLHHLEKLEVYGFNEFSLMVHKPTFPRTLKKLILVRVRFPWKDMSIIGSLPNLQVLKLRGDACNGETWETVEGEFLELRFLLIGRSGLRHWITESNHFPRLKCLVLRSCLVLKEIPEGIGEIPTLELIEVDLADWSLVQSAMQIKEEQQSYGNYELRVHVSHLEEESWQRSAHRH